MKRAPKTRKNVTPAALMDAEKFLLPTYKRQPLVFTHGRGPYVFDSTGKKYLDFLGGIAVNGLGHAHPKIVEAVQRAAADGTSFGAPTAREVELAEVICERVPSVEKVRLVSSGTEAAMTAVRLARGATGRSKVVKFAGCYHGHSDALLASGGEPRGVIDSGLPGPKGNHEFVLHLVHREHPERPADLDRWIADAVG